MVKIAFLFPGQGSQVVGMAKASAERSTKAAELVKRADEILGFSLSSIMFDGPEDRLRETSVTQPALFVSSAAALATLAEKGVSATWAAGHSLGEYSALYAAGVLDFETALGLVRARGEAMNKAAVANPGTMAAVIGLETAKVDQACLEASSLGVCTAANYNSESQIVISGAEAAVKKAMELATSMGAAKVVQLNVSGAFHSSLMAPAVEAMRPEIEKSSFNNARFPVYTNVDAAPTVNGQDFRSKLLKQIDHSVRWHEIMTAVNAAGAEMFIEVGSGRVLSTMAKKLDRKKVSLATDDFSGIEKALLSSGTPS